MKLRSGIVLPRDFYQLLTDLGADAEGWFHRGQEAPGLATHFENPLAGLDDEAQHALDAVIVVTISLDPLVSARGDAFL